MLVLSIAFVRESLFSPPAYPTSKPSTPVNTALNSVEDPAPVSCGWCNTSKAKPSTNVGNTYINRNIVGAVVGSQPFGGHKKSGTGPKAGGPEYLKKFCYEYSISNNLVAMGGNIELLSRIPKLFKYSCNL